VGRRYGDGVRDSVLYFPQIEIPDTAWLRNALLLWDNVYRIVPPSYTPQDSDDVKRAVDAGMLRPVRLEAADTGTVTAQFTSFLRALEFYPAGLVHDEMARLHTEKIDATLYPILERYSKAEKDGWLELPIEIVRGYMFFLANQVAKRRNLARCTENKEAYAISAFFAEEGNFNDYVHNEEADGFYSALIFNDVLPLNVLAIPMEDVLRVAQKTKDERAEFREQLSRFTAQLHACESKEHGQTILADFKHNVLAAKERLKAAQGFMNKNDTGCLFSIGVPTALSVYTGFLGAGRDPFDGYALAASVAIGAIAAYYNYKQVSSPRENPYGASYLIALERDFAGSSIPRLHRAMEEFLND
jgi:hypothetical protein